MESTWASRERNSINWEVFNNLNHRMREPKSEILLPNRGKNFGEELEAIQDPKAPTKWRLIEFNIGSNSRVLSS